MNERLIKKRLYIFGLMLILLSIVYFPDYKFLKFREPVCATDLLCVVFLDVGQGDAIFIQSPSGVQMLIDAGYSNAVLRELGVVMDYSDRNLDYLVMTHPDADHVGGMVGVLERFEIAQVIRTENNSDTELWKQVQFLINESQAHIYFAQRGQRYSLGEGVFLDILFPDTDTAGFESNKASIVARLIYKDTSFMLTGDSPKSIEEYLVLLEGEYLESDVLKVGHHGSRTSTSELFLSHVRPRYAIISAGKNNSYGHPHLEVTDLLFNFNVNTFSTAEEGRIVFWSDGKEVYVK